MAEVVDFLKFLAEGVLVLVSIALFLFLLWALHSMVQQMGWMG